jgi:hypothetical protein
MKHKLTVIGLVAAAALVVTAWAASLGQANSTTAFTAAKYPAVGTGVEEGTPNHFVVTGATLHCPNGGSTFEATLSGQSTSLTVTPHYTNCTGPLGAPATVVLNGCHYEFTSGVHTAANGHVHGSVHIRCPAGKRIEVTAGNCRTHVGEQTPTGTVTYKNLGGNQVTVTVELTIATEHTNLGFPCPFSNGKGTGTYTSNVVFSCFEDTGAGEGTAKSKPAYKHNSVADACHVKTV